MSGTRAAGFHARCYERAVAMRLNHRLARRRQMGAVATVEKLAAHDMDLVRTFIDGVSGIDGLTTTARRAFVSNRCFVRLEGVGTVESQPHWKPASHLTARIHCAPLVPVPSDSRHRRDTGSVLGRF